METPRLTSLEDPEVDEPKVRATNRVCREKSGNPRSTHLGSSQDKVGSNPPLHHFAPIASPEETYNILALAVI